MKNIKYSTLSPASLVLAVVAYVVLVQAFGGFVLIEVVNGAWVEAFDRQAYRLTKGAWHYASLDIASAITIGVPLLLLALSIFFGARALRNKEATKWERMGAIISITLSCGLLAMVGIGLTIL